jgi:hypothetical protein
MLIFASDVWVTIKPLQISYLSLTVNVGGKLFKMYTKCTTVQNGGLVSETV